jgi:general secretion pathway protein D
VLSTARKLREDRRRVPVATGSFQPGIGGVGINPLVNTQFQYLDVGVNIDITPRVHANGEVTLKISMDVSAVTGQRTSAASASPSSDSARSSMKSV